MKISLKVTEETMEIHSNLQSEAQRRSMTISGLITVILKRGLLRVNELLMEEWESEIDPASKIELKKEKEEYEAPKPHNNPYANTINAKFSLSARQVFLKAYDKLKGESRQAAMARAATCADDAALIEYSNTL